MAKHEQAAKDILQTFEDVLDEMEMKHETSENDFRIHFYYQGEDMRHRMNISIDPERANFRLVIVLPFDITSEKALDIAEAVCRINDTLMIGQFTYDMEQDVAFEACQLFIDSMISRELIETSINLSISTVGRYDDRLLAINKGYLQANEVFKGLD